MKKVYLDTNIFIDILTNRNLKTVSLDELKPLLKESLVYMSTLSIHITYYILKIKAGSLSDKRTKDLISIINLVSLSIPIVENSLNSFETDFEDTLQYYSALSEDCDYILTRDTKDFLKIKEDIPSNIEIIDTLKDLN
jgi:predicted nucleic acid-binding protein